MEQALLLKGISWGACQTFTSVPCWPYRKSLTLATILYRRHREFREIGLFCRWLARNSSFPSLPITKRSFEER